MVIFSPQPLKKWIFLDFFVKVAPPGTVKMQKCAIFAMDSIRWWCLLSKNHRISNLRELFHSEKYRAFTQHAAVAVMRHSATIHSSIPDSKTAAYGHQSNSGRYMLGQYRTAVISKWHSYLDFADVTICHGIPWNFSCQRNWRAHRNWRTPSSMIFHGTSRVSEIGAFKVPWNSMEFNGTARVSEIGAFQYP